MKLSDLEVTAGPNRVDRAVYTDEKIYALEQERIFEKSWIFLCHASELERPGDYRSGEVAGQPVVAVKGADGKVRAFYNSCRHKATLLLTERSGSCERIRCPYHHWTYDTEGNLRSVPRVEAYGPDFDLSVLGLVELPAIGVIFDLVFVSLDPDVGSLETYIGEALPHLKEIGFYSGESLTTTGVYDYLYDGNWKLLMENTVDDYHAEYLHDYAFSQRAKVFGMGTSGFQAKEGTHFSLELGAHGAFEQQDDVTTLVIQKNRTRRLYLNIFPTLIALYNPVWDETALRVIVPMAVDKTRVVNYVLVPRSADSERRRQIGERFHYSWGPGGRAGVDDINIFAQIQKGLKARAGGQVITSRGHMRPGPQGGPTEDHAVRAFWFGWRSMMAERPEEIGVSSVPEQSHVA